MHQTVHFPPLLIHLAGFIGLSDICLVFYYVDFIVA